MLLSNSFFSFFLVVVVFRQVARINISLCLCPKVSGTSSERKKSTAARWERWLRSLMLPCSLAAGGLSLCLRIRAVL